MLLTSRNSAGLPAPRLPAQLIEVLPAPLFGFLVEPPEVLDRMLLTYSRFTCGAGARTGRAALRRLATTYFPSFSVRLNESWIPPFSPKAPWVVQMRRVAGEQDPSRAKILCHALVHLVEALVLDLVALLPRQELCMRLSTISSDRVSVLPPRAAPGKSRAIFRWPFVGILNIAAIPPDRRVRVHGVAVRRVVVSRARHEEALVPGEAVEPHVGALRTVLRPPSAPTSQSASKISVPPGVAAVTVTLSRSARGRSPCARSAPPRSDRPRAC